MESKRVKWKNYHHQIYQIYHGMIAVSLVPFALLFLEWDSGSKETEKSLEGIPFLLFAQLVWLVAYLSWYVWKGKKVQYEVSEESVEGKMKEFKRKNLMKYGLLALAGFIAAGAMWIEPSFIFVIAYFSVLIQYSFLRPSEDKFVRDMQVSKEERKLMHSE